MKNPSRFDRGMRVVFRALLCVVAALIAFGVVRVAFGSEPLDNPLAEVLRRQGIFYEDRATPELKAVQLQELATAIEAATDPPPPGVKRKDWIALVVAIGWHESSWSIRIQKGDCKPHECDGGAARGPWQQHRHGRSDQDWDALIGLENVGFQAETAAGTLRRAYLTCRGSDATWPQGTINNYAGRACTATGAPGLEKRLQTWAKVRARL